MNMTTVAASTTFNQAYLPINLEKRRMCWENDYPFGVPDVNIADLINLDDMGLFLE